MLKTYTTINNVRVLKANWSRVDAEEHDPYLNEISKEAVARLQEEIDWELKSDILIKQGWTQVKISDDVVELKWIADNCKGRVHHNPSGLEWIFENEKDAIAFILRWL